MKAPLTAPLQKRQSVRTQAFSLSELIVAILIVGILVVLGVSGISAVRSRANDAKCLSNLRTSGQAILSFIHDNHGRFLETSSWFAYASNYPSRNRSMRDYFGVGHNSAAITDPVFLHDTVLTCPAMKAKYPQLYPSALNRGFGINYYLYLKDYNANKDIPGPRRIQNVPSLPAMMLLTDASVNGGLLGSLNENNVGSATKKHYLPLPHRGRQHVVFFDGHLESYALENFQKPQSRRNFWGNLNFTD